MTSGVSIRVSETSKSSIETWRGVGIQETGTTEASRAGSVGAGTGWVASCTGMLGPLWRIGSDFGGGSAMTGVTMTELFDEGGTWNAAGLYGCTWASSVSSSIRGPSIGIGGPSIGPSTISIFISGSGLRVPVRRDGRLGGGAGVMEA